MAENTSRGLFALNGITGALIATILLLAVLFLLVFTAINIQKTEATNYYEANNLDKVEMISTGNAKYDLSTRK